jgi:hypothetical protein
LLFRAFVIAGAVCSSANTAAAAAVRVNGNPASSPQRRVVATIAGFAFTWWAR